MRKTTFKLFVNLCSIPLDRCFVLSRYIVRRQPIYLDDESCAVRRQSHSHNHSCSTFEWWTGVWRLHCHCARTVFIFGEQFELLLTELLVQNLGPLYRDAYSHVHSSLSSSIYIHSAFPLNENHIVDHFFVILCAIWTFVSSASPWRTQIANHQLLSTQLLRNTQPAHMSFFIKVSK